MSKVTRRAKKKTVHKKRKKKSYFGSMKGPGPYEHEKFSDFD